MLPESGNLAILSNWRHILVAILLTLYKLFAMMVCNRIYQIVVASQSREQCAFTLGARFEDALCPVEIAIQHCAEFHKPLCVMSMDMRRLLIQLTMM